MRKSPQLYALTLGMIASAACTPDVTAVDVTASRNATAIVAQAAEAISSVSGTITVSPSGAKYRGSPITNTCSWKVTLSGLTASAEYLVKVNAQGLPAFSATRRGTGSTSGVILHPDQPIVMTLEIYREGGWQLIGALYENGGPVHSDIRVDDKRCPIATD